MARKTVAQVMPQHKLSEAQALLLDPGMRTRSAGGFSRLGLKAGKTEDEAARLVLEAVDLGINFIDTAAAYGTEGVIGRALTSLQRDQVSPDWASRGKFFRPHSRIAIIRLVH